MLLLLAVCLSLSMAAEWAVKGCCGAMAVLAAIGVPSPALRTLAAALLGADADRRCASTATAAAAASASASASASLSSASGGAWKSGGAGSSGSFATGGAAGAAAGDIDALLWLKLLFIPVLGILVLLCFLLEEWCATHTNTHTNANTNSNPTAGGASSTGTATLPSAAVQSQPSPVSSVGALGWLRSWWARAPRLTTAYSAQLQQNAAALVLAQQQHAMHAHMAHMAMHHGAAGSGAGSHAMAAAGALVGPGGPLCCGCTPSAHSNSGGSSSKKLLPSALHATSAGGALGGSGGERPSSPFSTAPLHLSFNGFNHLTGPLLYYHTFQREQPVGAKNNNEQHANGKHTTATNGSANGNRAAAASKKTAAAAAAGGSGKDAAISAAATTGDKSALSSPSAPSSPGSPSTRTPSPPPPPPSSEFVPLRLVNESTGFAATLSLWRGLTFGEILKYYVATHWSDERKRYESMEGGGSDSGSADPDGVVAALLEKGRLPQAKQAAAAAAPPLMLRYLGQRISPLLTPAGVFPAPPSPPPAAPVSPTATASSDPTADSTDSAKPASPSSPSSPSPAAAASVGSSAAAAAAAAYTPPVLEVCVDYLALFERCRAESNALLGAETARVRSSVELQGKLVVEVGKTDAEIGVLAKRVKELTERGTVVANDLKKAAKEQERVARDLAALLSQRSELEASMATSVGAISNARAKLEAEYRELRAAHESKQSDHCSQKAAYQTLLDERHDLSAALKASMIASDALQKKLTAIKVNKIKREKLIDKIRKLEQILAVGGNAEDGSASAQGSASGEKDATSSSSSSSSIVPGVVSGVSLLKHRYDQLEIDHNVLNVHLNELRVKSHEIDDLSKNESYKLRYRLKLLDKDVRDMAKWKATARAHEADAKDSVRWKQMLRQTKARERALDKEVKECAQWKMRARALERQVRDLRAWKGGLDAAGMGGEVPAFARELDGDGDGDGDGAASASAFSDDFDDAHTMQTHMHMQQGSGMGRAHRRSSSTASLTDEYPPSTHTPPDLDAAFAASLASFQQQQQQQHMHNHNGFGSLRSGSIGGGDYDLHSSFDTLHDSNGGSNGGASGNSFSHFSGASSWGGFGLDASGAAGSDVAAGSGLGGSGAVGSTGVGSLSLSSQLDADRELMQMSDHDADFTHNHPALSFLAE